jgi:hypothetical protein
VPLNEANYALIGISWQGMDGNPVLLTDLFSEESLYPGAYEWDVEFCDTLQVFVNSKQDWDMYYYVDTADGEGICWRDASFVKVETNSFSPGEAMWFFRPSAEGLDYVYVYGAVPTNASLPMFAKQGYSLIGKAFPVQELAGTGITGYPGEYEWDVETCDIMQVYDNVAKDYLKTFYYFERTDDGYGTCWRDVNFDPVAEEFNTDHMQEITYGEAAWYYHQPETTINWSETNPL